MGRHFKAVISSLEKMFSESSANRANTKTFPSLELPNELE